MTGNPVKYTSRTYNSIIDDINTDAELINKPNWFKRIWAGVGDVLSAIMNSIVNDLLLSENFTEKIGDDLLKLIDYYRAPRTTGSGKALFYVKTDLGTARFPFSATKENLTANSVGTNTSGSKRFESRTNETFSLVQDNFTVNTSTDQLTVTTDFAWTGHKCLLVTTGTLPAPLATATEYYIIYVNATTIKLATTLANAYAGVWIDITTTGTGTHTLQLFSKAVDVYQQETKDSVFIGTSDGITEWQEFILPDTDILRDTLSVVVNSVTWTRIDDFIDSISTDTHYKFITLSNGKYSIRFGNGTYGKVPGNFDVTATYAVGGGVSSNISTRNRLSNYTGNDGNIDNSSNPEIFTGGSEKESLETAKQIAPVLLKSRNRFITTSDGEALALAYGGFSQVKVNKNTYGVLSAQVLTIAKGGGNPSTSQKNALQAHLIDRTVLESIDVRVEDTTITSTAVTSGVKVLNGYSFANVKPYVDLGYFLLTTETGKEIKDTFNSTGIADAITLINTIFGSSFGTADYTEISQMLETFDYVEIAGSIQSSDVFSLIDNITGVDYITITTFGTGLPITLGSAEITTNGTITVSQIL
jgi:hypothetical protein